MQFNSIPFLFYFLPVFLAVYYITPKRNRNFLMLCGSAVFYYFAVGRRWWCLGLLCGLTFLVFWAGQWLQLSRSKGLLGLCLIGLAALLIFFKCYAGGTLLPPGMSFYLFQMAAYLIDVFRRECPEERSFLRMGAQFMLFPKLLSGPLVQPKKLQMASRHPSFCANTFFHGLQELILGLAMKVLLADRLGGLWVQAGVAGYRGISTPLAWMSLVAFALRLYFDFYGYSLMAMGIGRMVGYHLPQNFRDPYGACSVSEFYRRWHITLGAWFREYMYIPLGGSRKGTARTLFNLAVVWAFTGFWHGVGGNYLLWAGFLFFLIAMEKLWLGKVLKAAPVLGHGYTVFMILLSWVPFAIGDWEKMLCFLGKLFAQGTVVNPLDYQIIGAQYWPYLLAGVFFALPVSTKLLNKLRRTVWGDILLLGLLWAAVYCIATSAQSPFLYFQF